MRIDTEIERLLKNDGAVLKRDRKHLVWELANGKNFVQSKTPSDSHTSRNQLSELRRLLALPRTATISEPRKRREKPGRYDEPRPKRGIGSMADVMMASGAFEGVTLDALDSIQLEIQGLNGHMDEVVMSGINNLHNRVGTLEGKILKVCPCLLHRIHGWWTTLFSGGR